MVLENSGSIAKGDAHLRAQSWTGEDQWVCGCFHGAGAAVEGLVLISEAGRVRGVALAVDCREHAGASELSTDCVCPCVLEPCTAYL